VGGDQRVGEDPVSNFRAEENDAVDGDGCGVAEMRAEPGRRHRSEREPEQKVRVRPERGAADAVDDLQQMMVVVPVEGDEDEAE
jgi:hypothetical protein